MAVEAENARKPITHVFYGVTVPAYGSKLSLSNGVPTSGTEVGALGGPIEWNAGRSEEPFDSETNEAPLSYEAAEHSLEMSIKVKEFKSDVLQKALNGEAFTATDGTKILTVGTNTDLPSTAWVAVWETRAGSGEYEYAIVYNGVAVGGANISLTKASYSEIPLTIRAKPVTTRPTKDQLGHLNLLV